MKRCILLAIAALALAPGAFAQDVAAEIETALLAAPANLREAATVIRWKPDQTYDTLKQGTNRLVCYDRRGPLQQPFSVECTSIANLERVAQNIKFEQVNDRAKVQAMVAAADKDGTRVKPEYGSVFYNFGGADRASARAHMTVALPGATTATTGFPENAQQGGAWIMNAGTSTAHLMIPGH